MFVKTLYFPLREEVRYAAMQFLQVNVDQVADPATQVPLGNKNSTGGLLAQLLVGRDPQEHIDPIESAFSIVIPKIGANSKVVANVNPAVEDEYLPVLQQGVAHALGSALPGQGGHVYLFAHSTDYFWNVGTYNAVFYLLYKLQVGDEVDLFYNGQRFVYQVTGTKVVDPSEVQYITRTSNSEFLTLQTCWPPGTTLKRLLVFAKPKVQ